MAGDESFVPLVPVRNAAELNGQNLQGSTVVHDEIEFTTGNAW